MRDSSRNLEEYATLFVRLIAYAATVGNIGAFFLPWIRLDGTTQARSGAELITLGISPTANYLFSVSPIQAAALMGCPTLVILASLLVMVKYGRRQTALFATVVVLASAMATIFATQDITANDEPKIHLGLWIVVALSAALLLQQALIKLRTHLYYRRKLPAIYRTLSVITGSGYYRWNEGRAR